MKVDLAYGKKGLKIDLPANVHIDVVDPRFVPGIKKPMSAITHALQNPVEHSSLKEITDPDTYIAIVFSDITRATPYHTILPPLLKELNHIPDSHILFFCAAGTHREASKEELTGILGRDIVERFRIIQNNSADKSQFRLAGTSKAGNEIWLNAELMNSDLVILTGFIKPHFFAGFSGGGKAVMPGMAYDSSIRNNHSIANLSDMNARWGITKGNPVWEEIMEAAVMGPPVFLLNITLNRNKEITGVFAGDLHAAHEQGCRFAKDTAMAPVGQSYDLVISSNSGYPLDLNVYQTVKGMSCASQVVKEGGHIIMAAECSDGIPSGGDYERILSSVSHPDELMNYIVKYEKDLKDTWQLYFQALILKKSEVYLYSDKLENSVIKKALLKPVDNISAQVDGIIKDRGSSLKICVLPEGPQTIPYINDKHK